MPLDDGEVAAPARPAHARWSSRSRCCRPPTRCANRWCCAATSRACTTSARSGAREARLNRIPAPLLGESTMPRRHRRRAASASARRWRWRSRSRPTCCCSTSRPTTSTSTASRRSKNCCSGTSPASSSRTTAASSTAWRRASPSSIAACCAPSRATTRCTRSARPRSTLAEDLAHRRFEKFWAQEEVWIRKGVEARRTRNEGRVKRLEHLREERAARRERIGSDQAHRRHRRALGQAGGRARERQQEFRRPHDSRRRVSLRVMRGDRVGLLGPNGAGKTTLIKLIVGTLEPDCGPRAPRHQPAGRVLRPAARAARSRAHAGRDREPGLRLDRDRRDSASTSPATCSDFLFDSRRAQCADPHAVGRRAQPAAARAAVRAARQPAGARRAHQRSRHRVARAARDLLQDYTGTLLLVSHDRAFLDNVVTQTLAAEGDGRWREYVGGYSDWLRQRPQPRAPTCRSARRRRAAPAPHRPPKRKLSFKEQRELESLPGEIEKLEAEQQRAHAEDVRARLSSRRRRTRCAATANAPRELER